MFKNSWNEAESVMMIKKLQSEGKNDFDAHLSYHLCGTIAGLTLEKFNERKPAMKEACHKVVKITTEEDLHKSKLADLHRSMSSTFNHGVGGIFRNDIINPVSGLISSKIIENVQDKIKEDKKLQHQLEENQKLKELQESEQLPDLEGFDAHENGLDVFYKDIPEIVNKVGGRYPINAEYAGQKYPNSVNFDEKGFPDFGKYNIAEVELETIHPERRDKDFNDANKKSGLITPKGYTWHHVEHSNILQLVPRDLHDAIRHTGGCATKTHEKK